MEERICTRAIMPHEKSHMILKNSDLSQTMHTLKSAACSSSGTFTTQRYLQLQTFAFVDLKTFVLVYSKRCTIF